jgi:hypothetical protein
MQGKITMFFSGCFFGTSILMFLIVLLFDKGSLTVPIIFLLGGIIFGVLGFSDK